MSPSSADALAVVAAATVAVVVRVARAVSPLAPAIDTCLAEAAIAGLGAAVRTDAAVVHADRPGSGAVLGGEAGARTVDAMSLDASLGHAAARVGSARDADEAAG
jgi:hypothetical protein